MVVDQFYRAPRIIGAEQKILLTPHRGSGEIERRAVGGVVLNHLGWARILGLETGVFGKMGDDHNGLFLRQGLDRFGIQQHLTLDGSSSSFAAVFVDPAGERAIYMSRGATGELRPDEIESRHGAFIRRAQMVSTEISQVPLKTVIAILRYARALRIPTVLDVDVPPSDACPALGTPAELERALKLATILKPAKAAARELAGTQGDPLKLANALRKRYGSRAAVMTDGPGGCAISAEDAALRVAAFKTKALDSTGAGDAFLGGLLAGLRWGLPWERAGRLANAAGAVCVAQLGAFPASPDLRENIQKLFGAPLPAPREAGPEAPSTGAGDPHNPLAEVESFFDLCIEELSVLRGKFDPPALLRAVELIRSAQERGGRVHVTGVGKPEHVARYAASLLSSVGTMATFLHATETLHGSLGQVHPEDVVIAISNSGDTAEICAAAAAIKDHGSRLVAVTGNPHSRLTQLSDAVLLAQVEREGGVLGLAPRASILAQIYVLAGLSVALEAARGLTIEEYSRWHQAGALGEAARRLARRKLKAV